MWLAFLLAQASLLLVFQLVVGFAAGSLALLADSGHSGADVIAYGVNYFVERQKVLASARGSDRWGRVAAAANVARMDVCGTVVSIALLFASTCFATAEAIERLRAPPATSASDAGCVGASCDMEGGGSAKFGGVGGALLAFAVLSTALNVVTLIFGQRWGVVGGHAGPRSDSVGAEPLGGDVEMRSAVGIASQAAGPEPPVPLVPHVPASAGVILEQRRRSRKAIVGLNLIGDFAGLHNRMDTTAMSPCKGACGDAACEAEADSDGYLGVGAESGGRSAGQWRATLHALVHPGCDGRHAEIRLEAVDASERKSNLNVTSAWLHLVTDALRGITILIVALVIEAGFVTDPGKADALCALLVAAFVALGSFALLPRAWDALRDQFRQ